MNKTMIHKLNKIRAAGREGLVIRDLTKAIHDLRDAGLVTIEQNTPIKRHGAPGWNYRVTATIY